jgi:hypothetical protein
MTQIIKGEEIFECIKTDLPQEQVDELTLAAQAAAHFIVVAEGRAHVESVKDGPLPHEFMCLARGVELGFLLGFSAGDRKKATEEEKIKHPQLDFAQIFEDMRTRRSLIDAGLEGGKQGEDGPDLVLPD